MLALLHMVMVIGVYQIVVANGNSYLNILWAVLAILDYPASMGLALDALQKQGDYRWNNELMPLMYFGTIGTLWWFLLGTAFSSCVAWVWRKLKKSKGLR